MDVPLSASLGWRTQVDAKTNSTTNIYDALSRVKEVQDRAGKSTFRTYDSAGRLATIKDAENKITTYGYDILGRRTSTTLADSSARAMTYDAAGRVTRTDLPSGKSSTNVYRDGTTDVSGLRHKVEYRDATDTLVGTNTFSYDDFLRPDGSTSRYGVSTAMSYTDRGQLASESTTYGGQTYTVGYAYDDRGRRNEITYPSGRKAAYSHDERGLLDTIDWDGSEIEDRGYDERGLLTSVDRPSVDETRSYFDDNRVQTIGNANVGTATYAYDNNGNKLSESWSGVMSAWNFTTQKSGAAFPGGYDEEDRFMNFVQSGQSKDSTFTRSDIGNISNVNLNGASTARIYSNVHELETIGSDSQSFDVDGNLILAANGNTFEWNEDGLLVSSEFNHVLINGGPLSSGDFDQYKYDAAGRRTYKKTTPWQGSSFGVVSIYAGPNCIAEYFEGYSPTNARNEYVYAGGIDSLTMLVRSNGTENLAITRNQQWSVSALVNTAGTVVERYAYDKFGKRTILAANGSTVRTFSSYNMPYGYTSRRHDQSTGLMYFRARYYDSGTGEFISRDPLEYVDGMSQYRGYFVPNAMDPTGTDEYPVDFIGPLLPGDTRTQKASWLARLEAVRKLHSGYSYFTGNMDAYLDQLNYYINYKPLRFNVGGAAGTSASARFVYDSRNPFNVIHYFYSDHWNHRIETSGPISGVPLGLVVHESVHVRNYYTYVAETEGGDFDEKIAHAMEFLFGENGLQPLRDFENKWAGGGDCCVAQKEWSDLWWISPTRFPDGRPKHGARGLAATLLQLRWANIETGNSGSLSNGDWIRILDYSIQEFSCSELAKIYSKKIGCDLSCPDDMPAVFK